MHVCVGWGGIAASVRYVGSNIATRTDKICSTRSLLLSGQFLPPSPALLCVVRSSCLQIPLLAADDCPTDDALQPQTAEVPRTLQVRQRSR